MVKSRAWNKLTSVTAIGIIMLALPSMRIIITSVSPASGGTCAL